MPDPDRDSAAHAAAGTLADPHAFAHAHGKVFFLMLVKDVVLIELRGIEVNVAARLVGIAAFNQPLDQADAFLNAIRCRFNKKISREKIQYQ